MALRFCVQVVMYRTACLRVGEGGGEERNIRISVRTVRTAGSRAMCESNRVPPKYKSLWWTSCGIFYTTLHQSVTLSLLLYHALCVYKGAETKLYISADNNFRCICPLWAERKYYVKEKNPEDLCDEDMSGHLSEDSFLLALLACCLMYECKC
jgi:hypothetical protein